MGIGEVVKRNAGRMRPNAVLFLGRFNSYVGYVLLSMKKEKKKYKKLKITVGAIRICTLSGDKQTGYCLALIILTNDVKLQ